MARRTHDTDTDTGDHDSFLDIVANMVGILIILVMVVSIRARSAPDVVEEKPLPTLSVNQPNRTSAALESEIRGITGKIKVLERETQARDRERQQLATLLVGAEQALAKRREQLDADDQAEYDLRRQLALGRQRLAEIDQRKTELARAPKNVVQLKNLPTPISETVVGKEVHFQLRDSLLAHLPIEALFLEAKGEARQKVWKLDGEHETTEIVGPINGFRMRYTLEKVQIPYKIQVETGRGGYLIRARRWDLIPTSSRLGEPLAQALAPSGGATNALRGLDPKETTITVWIYPDSFDAFRELKQFLFDRGFATAGRPLPKNVPIGGSPNGTRSSAQ